MPGAGPKTSGQILWPDGVLDLRYVAAIQGYPAGTSGWKINTQTSTEKRPAATG